MSSGTPYIGSKISLVSKAEIRYEGFLYTIDQNDSTVTLAKVISLGTEDRVPESPVPAREEVFEYIVFRGSDIKDLHVCEGPKRVEDPAIVHQSSHSYSQNYNPNYHHHRSPFGGGIPNFGYNPFNFHPNGPGDVSGSRQHTPPNLPRADSRGGQPKNQMGGFQDNNRNKVRGNDGRYKEENDRYAKDNRDNSNKSMKDGRDQYDDSRDSRGSKDNRDAKNKDRVGRGTRQERENVDRRGQRSSSRENADKYDNRERKDTGDSRDNRDRRNNRDKDSKDSRYIKDNRYYRDNRYRQNKRDNQDDEQQRVGSDGSRGQSRGRGGRGYNGRGGNRRGAPRGGGNNRTKFTEDFDFEKANAQFKKEEIEEELLKVLKKVKIKDDDGGTELKDEMDEREMDERAPLPSPDKFYDRSKSFFDNILCEAMIPKSEDEVMTRRQEQALNAETFGTSASHFRPGYRGRGRGRGRWRGQGRGGFYRGRGNYRGNSNRRWVDYEFDYEAAGIKNRHQPMKVSSGGLE